MPAEQIEVKMPHYPTLPDFERVIDRVVAPGAYRREFVEMFFDAMLDQRADFNMDGAIHAVALQAARTFAAQYEAHVAFDPDRRMSVTFENVAAFVSVNTFDSEEMRGIIDHAMSRKVDEVGIFIKEKCGEIAEIFEYDGRKMAIVIAKAWLDYIDALRGERGYFRFIQPRRELTILKRSYELLVASVVTPKGR